MGRVWQAAGTVQAVLRPGLLEKAVDSGLRSLFVGFETLDEANLRAQHKMQNLGGGYDDAVRRLHDLGVMVNAAFVFGMDEDDPGVFDRTVEWAVSRGIETATFHILTPYPGTGLERRLTRGGARDEPGLGPLRHDSRGLRPAGHDGAPARGQGYRRAYRRFSWRNIGAPRGRARTPARRPGTSAYTAGWKKLEPMWDVAIRSGQVHRFLPLLEAILDRFSAAAAAPCRARRSGPLRRLRLTPAAPRPARTSRPIGGGASCWRRVDSCRRPPLVSSY